MGEEKISITTFIDLYQHYPTIDVRSEQEYEHAHIPGAVSLPLFSNEERKIVGTIYKQQSREAAIKKGLEFFGPKMKDIIVFVEKLLKEKNLDSKILVIHCWRGGMRSAAIAWLLDLYGFKIYTIIGGYQAYRNWVLDQFKIDWKFNILGGYTGSGKTIILQKFEKLKIPFIDLEGIAGHKGSAFGRIGLPPQQSCEMFENTLAKELQKHATLFPNQSIWLEDESQRIGSVSIPHELWLTIRKQNVFFIKIPFEQRLEYIEETYGKLNNEELQEAVLRIKKKLGGLETKLSIEFLQKGNIKEAFRILLHYYDKLYQKALDQRENLNEKLHLIESNKVDSNINAQLIIKNI
jgi:tRNA 2-selenouridine synthase